MLAYIKMQTLRCYFTCRLLLAVLAALCCLPASAVILLGWDSDANFVAQSANMPSIVISSAFPSASSSPSLARNLQRAHAWSQHGSPTPIYYITPSRQSSLQSNVARAQAFRQNP